MRFRRPPARRRPPLAASLACSPPHSPPNPGSLPVGRRGWGGQVTECLRHVPHRVGRAGSGVLGARGTAMAVCQGRWQAGRRAAGSARGRAWRSGRAPRWQEEGGAMAAERAEQQEQDRAAAAPRKRLPASQPSPVQPVSQPATAEQPLTSRNASGSSPALVIWHSSPEEELVGSQLQGGRGGARQDGARPGRGAGGGQTGAAGGTGGSAAERRGAHAENTAATVRTACLPAPHPTEQSSGITLPAPYPPTRCLCPNQHTHTHTHTHIQQQQNTHATHDTNTHKKQQPHPTPPHPTPT